MSHYFLLETALNERIIVLSFFVLHVHENSGSRIIGVWELSENMYFAFFFEIESLDLA